jgi:hypothetical protein
MKRMVVFMLVVALILGFAQVSKAEEKTEYQNSYTTGNVSILTKYVIMENAWLTIAEVNKANGESATILLGYDTYVYSIGPIDEYRYILAGTGRDWDMSVVFVLDTRSSDFSVLFLKDGEYLNDYWVLTNGMYFSTTFYPEGEKPSTRFVKYWSYYGEPVKVDSFGQKKAVVDIIFGFTEGIGDQTGILTVSGKQATAYRVIGKDLILVKKFALPVQAGNIGFYIFENGIVDYWYYKWFSGSTK